MIDRVAEVTIKQLYNYPGNSFKFKLKNSLKKALGRDYQPTEPMHWPKGILLKGLEDYSKSEKASDLEREKAFDVIKRYIDSWIDSGAEFLVIDDMIAAEVLFYLYDRTGDEKYKKAIEKGYLFLSESRKNKEESFVYRPSQKNEYILADMVGMVCPFLCMYGSNFHEEKALELSEKQILNFVNSGLDEKIGLPYHGYEIGIGCHGIIGWGRAVGWILRGISFFLSCADNSRESYGAILQAYNKLVKNTMIYLRTDNTFSWQLETIKGHKDISATAMIVNSLLRCNNRYDAELMAVSSDKKADDKIKLVDSQIKYADCPSSNIVDDKEIEKIISGIKMSIDDGVAKEVLCECPGFSMHPQIYGSYPWGQGTVLSVLSLGDN